jgi:alkanesulfonate monooxygenase SsuD/methylene tetrahydromethanopterin reductase-like flavin-dependent oxidoreductase (luciferase family)
MHIMYFTERPYPYVPEEEIIRNGGSWGLPNRLFDPVKGGQMYNRYFDEKQYAEEVGFDGVMLNEHHGTPFCMGASINIEAAVLARITKRVKIILLGNPLPVVANPLKLAEELAEIDMISGGRLVPGFVRGAGTEQLSNNANPAFNRELFNEAHDVIIQAWTKPGPFRYEGKHFHYRYINPWALPIQKPHPPIWIPGIVSPDTLMWCAKHRYPFIALATFLEPTVEMWNLYADIAAQEGYQAGPENFGYLQQVCVAETEEKAQELGKSFLYGGSTFGRAEWMFPPGYNSKAATQRLARQFTDPNTGQQAFRFFNSAVGMDVEIEAAKQRIYGEDYLARQKNLQLIVGTPKTIIPKIRILLETLRPGVFGFWHHEASPNLTHQDTLTSLRLLGQEILPAVREIGKELGLIDPYQRQPGSRPLAPSGVREPVAGAVTPAVAAAL